jgi:hypothetical protein
MGRYFTSLKLVVSLVATLLLQHVTSATVHVDDLPRLQILSIEQMALDADTVFSGTAIVSSTHAIHQVNGLPARVTGFAVREALKGDAKSGETFHVTQFLPHSAPTENGESVLWYLKREAPDSSFSTLLGYSADFRVVYRGIDKGVTMVQNQVSNRGLWGNEKGDRLWNHTTLRRSVAEEYLSDYLKRTYPAFAKDERALTRRIKEILDFGEAPCQARAVPLELLLSATYAVLNQP